MPGGRPRWSSSGGGSSALRRRKPEPGGHATGAGSLGRLGAVTAPRSGDLLSGFLVSQNDREIVLRPIGAGEGVLVFSSEVPVTVSVSDGRGLVAAGRLTRVVVDAERFMDRAT